MPTWLQALVRHGLTTLGGVLIAKGVLDEGLVNELIGAVMTVLGVLWSLIDKRARA